MKPADIDALVTILNQAIEKRFEQFKESFEREQKRSLIQVAKSAVRTDAELWAKELDDKVKRMIADIPKPENGKDGESATPEQIAQAIAQYMEANPVTVPVETVSGEVAKYLQANPPAKGEDGVDGKDGERGLDAIQIEILPNISANKRYAKGTYARYKGGIVRAYRDTDQSDDVLAAGWEVIVNGVDDIQIHQLKGGEFAIKTLLTSGQSNITKAYFPTMEYKGVWKESNGEYAKGHTVTQSGSLWHCNRPTTDKPGTSDAWTLCAKKGVDGKDLNVVKLHKPDVVKL